MRFIHPLTNFGSGELSEELFGRIDVKEYQTGLSNSANCLLNAKGGAYKRIGAKSKKLVGGISDAENINILDFTLENGESVILEFVRSSLGIYSMRLLDSELNNITLNYSYVPFIGSQDLIPNWNGVAIGRKIYVTNYLGTTHPFIINLTNLASVTVEPMPLKSFKGVPFQDVNIDNTKKMRILNANTQGPYTIQASGFSPFTPDHVDMQLMISGITKFTQIIDVDENTYTFNKFASAIFLITGYISPTQVQGYAFHNYSYGCTLANVSGFSLTPASTTEYFDEWRFGSWGKVPGYPKLFSAFEGRLIACGTPAEKDRMYASRINASEIFQDVRYPTPEEQVFSYFRITDENTDELLIGPEGQTHEQTYTWDIYNGDIQSVDPYQFAIASKDSAPIAWMESSRYGVIGTFNKQYFLDGDGTVVSQTNIGIRPFATKSAYPLLAIAIDNTVFYTDGTRTKVYMYMYNESNGSYISKEVSLLYGKFSKDNYITVMKQSREFDCILLMTSLGDCVALAYGAETGILGFTKFFTATANTKMIDIITVNTPDYTDRTIAAIKLPNGNMQYHSFDDEIALGFVDPIWHTDEYYSKFNYLDQLFPIFELYSDVIPYMDRFDSGTTLAIYATDGVTTDVFEVDHDGAPTYTLPTSYKSVVVGVKYAFEIATMPIEAGQAYATAQTGMKRVDQALIRTSGADEVKVGTDGYNYDLVPITDNKAIFEVPGSTESDHIIYIRHDSEGPCMINNIVLRGVNNDG